MKTLVLLAMAGVAIASPIMVGPIGLTGSGTLTTPDDAAYGGEGFGGVGLVWSATGTNGTDTVSISTRDIDIGSGVGPAPVGGHLWLSSYCPYIDIIGPLCNVNIDGVTGWGEFHDIGSPHGILQVYDSGNLNTRVLLAQAEITNTVIEVTDINPNPRHAFGSVVDFSVTDPPPSVPEPSAFILMGSGLLLWITARSIPK